MNTRGFIISIFSNLMLRPFVCFSNYLIICILFFIIDYIKLLLIKRYINMFIMICYITIEYIY